MIKRLIRKLRIQYDTAGGMLSLLFWGRYALSLKLLSPFSNGHFKEGKVRRPWFSYRKEFSKTKLSYMKSITIPYLLLGFSSTKVNPPDAKTSRKIHRNNR